MQNDTEGKRFIYTLSHPVTKEVRYVGQTNNLKVRFYGHISGCKNRKNHCQNWMYSIIVKGLRPFMEVLEECNIDDVDANEILYIALLKSWGFKLTNIESGGSIHKSLSEETKAKISASGKGRIISFETRDKMSKANAGQKRSDITKQNMSKARTGMRLKPLTAEHRKKVSESNIGKKWSPKTLELKSKIVFDTNTGIFYQSAKEAAAVYDISSDNLRRYLRGDRTNKTSLIYA
ncbi:MAG: NUMOD3 domain-containing DNA-binding protein [Bacteroidota bacterium]